MALPWPRGLAGQLVLVLLLAMVVGPGGRLLALRRRAAGGPRHAALPADRGPPGDRGAHGPRGAGRAAAGADRGRRRAGAGAAAGGPAACRPRRGHPSAGWHGGSRGRSTWRRSRCASSSDGRARPGRWLDGPRRRTRRRPGTRRRMSRRGGAGGWWAWPCSSAPGRWLEATLAPGPPPLGLAQADARGLAAHGGAPGPGRGAECPADRAAVAGLGRRRSGSAAARPSRPCPRPGRTSCAAPPGPSTRCRPGCRRFIDDRTRMMAALGHDLRTPITALRLRAELVEEEEARERLLATLDEMHQMVEAALGFLRDEAASEPAREVDLAALVEGLCEDLARARPGRPLHRPRAAGGTASAYGAQARLAQPDRERRRLWEAGTGGAGGGRRARSR